VCGWCSRIGQTFGGAATYAALVSIAAQYKPNISQSAPHNGRGRRLRRGLPCGRGHDATRWPDRASAGIDQRLSRMNNEAQTIGFQSTPGFVVGTMPIWGRSPKPTGEIGQPRSPEVDGGQ
jgi:hypothetical protein